MKVTALAAEALLGLLSMMASVTLASILTVILLPWALLSLRHSAGFAWMVPALIGMT